MEATCVPLEHIILNKSGQYPASEVGDQLDGKRHLLLVYFQQIFMEDVAMMTYMSVKKHLRNRGAH